MSETLVLSRTSTIWCIIRLDEIYNVLIFHLYSQSDSCSKTTGLNHEVVSVLHIKRVFWQVHLKTKDNVHSLPGTLNVCTIFNSVLPTQCLCCVLLLKNYFHSVRVYTHIAQAQSFTFLFEWYRTAKYTVCSVCLTERNKKNTWTKHSTILCLVLCVLNTFLMF